MKESFEEFIKEYKQNHFKTELEWIEKYYLKFAYNWKFNKPEAEKFLDKITDSFGKRGNFRTLPWSSNDVIEFVMYLSNSPMLYKDAILKIEEGVFFPIIYNESINDKLSKYAKEFNLSDSCSWKRFNSVNVAMAHATEENKWEMFEYYAVKNPSTFITLIRLYIVKKKVVENIRFTEEEILERYSNKNPEELPEPIAKLLETIKKENAKREKEQLEKRKVKEEQKIEREKSWLDNDGNLIQYFTLGNIQPKTETDYEKILIRYLKEDLTINKFCEKYKISSVEGFKKNVKQIF